MRTSRLVLAMLLALGWVSLLRADETNVQALQAGLENFTRPAIPEEIKQQLRDYVSEDLRARRDAANRRSTAEWEAITSCEAWEKFRREKMTRLRKSLGRSFAADDWQPPQVTSVEIAGTIQGEGYRIEKILYRSAYGQWITANLYVPTPPREKMPGFVISHSHHTPKEHGELQDMGVLWARAGCYVLVPDHLGHGERRQHPFHSKADYDKEFQVSRQDYYFRYDLHLQLNLVGESLMGCLASDLMSGVSVLHQQPGIDREKIILLGAVAGGGDPCAVAAALDERITCAAPFNFGGPQPETRYPLPEGVEFNYGGSGSWESTRNLAFSYRDGFLPWVIVGSIAPRRLIYGHEFSWDREHDPVWARLQKIYGWYDKPGHLAATHGYGTLTSKDPPGSHCTHIGKVHRKQMHDALAQWFGIQLRGGDESTDRRNAAELKCWTPELREKLKPELLRVTLKARFDQEKPSHNHAGVGKAYPAKVTWASEQVAIGSTSAQARQAVIQFAERRLVPLLLIEPSAPSQAETRAVVVFSRADKQAFVRQRASTIASLVDAGFTVILPDLYSSGLTGTGSDLGRRSSNTGRSSTLAMHANAIAGGGLIDEQVEDAWALLKYLTNAHQWAIGKVVLWSDSLIPPTAGDVNLHVPRDDDSRIPRGPDPLPHEVARRVGALTKSKVLYSRGSVSSFGAVLEYPLVLLPHDAIPYSRVQDHIWPPLPETTKVRLDETVDAINRPIASGSPDHDPAKAAAWMIAQLQK
jgi:dienelactone hydrolase